MQANEGLNTSLELMAPENPLVKDEGPKLPANFKQNLHEHKHSELLPSAYQDQQEKPQSVKLDKDLATIGTVSGVVSLATSIWEAFQGEAWRDFRHPISDFFMKIRQICQYSIHAKPSTNTQQRDDVWSDYADNKTSTELGILAYAINTFVEPWVFLVTNTLSLSKGAFSQFAKRSFESIDLVFGRLTSLYWNWRRVSKAFIPHSEGGLSSKQVTSAHKIIKNGFAQFSYRTLSKIAAATGLTSVAEKYENKLKNLEGDPIKQTLFALKSYQNNIKTLFTGDYTDPDTGEIKSLREEPDQHIVYTRAKLVSQILGLPVGLIGGGLNILSGMIAPVAHMFNFKKAFDFSTKLGDLANAVQNTLYLTNEVQAHANIMWRDITRNQTNKYTWWSAGIYSIGVVSNFLQMIRPFTNNLVVRKLAAPLMRLFFTGNRLRLHSIEWDEAKKTGMQSDIKKAEGKSIWTLIPRILMFDPKVTHTLSTAESSKHASLSSE